MKKYAWIVALLVALSFGFLGCPNGDGKEPPEGSEGDVIALYNQTVDMNDNFQYGEGYQGFIDNMKLFPGGKITEGDVYVMKIIFKTTRDLEEPLTVGLVDKTPPGGGGDYWIPLSYDAEDDGWDYEDDDAPATVATVEDAADGAEVDSWVTFTALHSALTAQPIANSIAFETQGEGDGFKDGKEGTANSGVKKPFKLTISALYFVKADDEDAGKALIEEFLKDEEEPPPPPPEYVPEFTIDAEAGTATHVNFVIDISTSSAHGAFEGTDNEDGTFTYKNGAIRYQYPVVAGVFDYKDYDFVEVEYEASDVAGQVLKQYDSGLDYALLSGSFATGEDTLKFDLRYGNGGFAIQKYAPPDMTVEIKSITFIKGTRYPITFNADGGTPAPAATYVVATTAVGPLPVLSKTGFIHLGWKMGTTDVTSATTVDATFNNAVLTAQWKAAKTLAPQTVTFTTTGTAGDSGFLVAKGAGTAAAVVTAIDTPTTGIGYSVDAKAAWGNSFAYFTYVFDTGSDLSDFLYIQFKYKGLSGDINGKQLKVFALTQAAMNQKGDYFGFGDPNAIISAASVTGEEEITIQLTINQGAATSLDGATSVCFAIGMNADLHKFQITDFVFSQTPLAPAP